MHLSKQLYMFKLFGTLLTAWAQKIKPNFIKMSAYNFFSFSSELLVRVNKTSVIYFVSSTN